jgi:hypothetical protein
VSRDGNAYHLAVTDVASERGNWRVIARFMRQTAVRVLLVMIIVAAPSIAGVARAQTSQRTPPASTRFFVGAAVTRGSAHAAEEYPQGYGYINPYFHDVHHPAVLGALFSAGVPVSKAWSLGGELALQRSRSSEITEQFRGHFEFTDLSGRYSERDVLVSFIVRHHWRPGSHEIQPLAGVTFARRTQRMEDFTGTYKFPGGVWMIDRPDVERSSTVEGIAMGIDYLVRMHPRLSLSFDARLHRFASRSHRRFPHGSPYVVLLGAGARWP